MPQIDPLKFTIEADGTPALQTLKKIDEGWSALGQNRSGLDASIDALVSKSAEAVGAVRGLGAAVRDSFNVTGGSQTVDQLTAVAEAAVKARKATLDAQQSLAALNTASTANVQASFGSVQHQIVAVSDQLLTATMAADGFAEALSSVKAPAIAFKQPFYETDAGRRGELEAAAFNEAFAENIDLRIVPSADVHKSGAVIGIVLAEEITAKVQAAVEGIAPNLPTGAIRQVTYGVGGPIQQQAVPTDVLSQREWFKNLPADDPRRRRGVASEAPESITPKWIQGTGTTSGADEGLDISPMELSDVTDDYVKGVTDFLREKYTKIVKKTVAKAIASGENVDPAFIQTATESAAGDPKEIGNRVDRIVDILFRNKLDLIESKSAQATPNERDAAQLRLRSTNVDELIQQVLGDLGKPNQAAASVTGGANIGSRFTQLPGGKMIGGSMVNTTPVPMAWEQGMPRLTDVIEFVAQNMGDMGKEVLKQMEEKYARAIKEGVPVGSATMVDRLMSGYTVEGEKGFRLQDAMQKIEKTGMPMAEKGGFPMAQTGFEKSITPDSLAAIMQKVSITYLDINRDSVRWKDGQLTLADLIAQMATGTRRDQYLLSDASRRAKQLYAQGFEGTDVLAGTFNEPTMKAIGESRAKQGIAGVVPLLGMEKSVKPEGLEGLVQTLVGVDAAAASTSRNLKGASQGLTEFGGSATGLRRQLKSFNMTMAIGDMILPGRVPPQVTQAMGAMRMATYSNPEMAAGLMKVIPILGSVGLAAGVAGFAIKTMMDSLADADKKALALERLNRIFGDTRAVIADLKMDFGGQLSESQIMQGLGGVTKDSAVAASPDKLSQMALISREQSQKIGTPFEQFFPQVTQAVQTGNVAFLEQSGLVVDGTRVLREYADMQNTSVGSLTNFDKQMALVNAIIAENQRLLTEFPNALERNQEAVDKLGVAWESFAKGIKTKVTPAFTELLNAASWYMSGGLMDAFSGDQKALDAANLEMYPERRQEKIDNEQKKIDALTQSIAAEKAQAAQLKKDIANPTSPLGDLGARVTLWDLETNAIPRNEAQLKADQERLRFLVADETERTLMILDEKKLKLQKGIKALTDDPWGYWGSPEQIEQNQIELKAVDTKIAELRGGVEPTAPGVVSTQGYSTGAPSQVALDSQDEFNAKLLITEHGIALVTLKMLALVEANHMAFATANIAKFTEEISNIDASEVAGGAERVTELHRLIALNQANYDKAADAAIGFSGEIAGETVIVDSAKQALITLATATDASAEALKKAEADAKQFAAALDGIESSANASAYSMVSQLVPKMGLVGAFKTAEGFKGEQDILGKSLAAENEARVAAGRTDLITTQEMQGAYGQLLKSQQAGITNMVRLGNEGVLQADRVKKAWDSALEGVIGGREDTTKGLLPIAEDPEDFKQIQGIAGAYEDVRKYGLEPNTVAKEVSNIMKGAGAGRQNTVDEMARQMADVVKLGTQSPNFAGAIAALIPEEVQQKGQQAIREYAAKLLVEHQKGFSNTLMSVDTATDRAIDNIRSKQTQTAFVGQVKDKIKERRAAGEVMPEMTDDEILKSMGVDTTPDKIAQSLEDQGMTLQQILDQMIGKGVTVDVPNPIVDAAVVDKKDAVELAKSGTDAGVVMGTAFQTQIVLGDYGGGAVQKIIESVASKQDSLKASGTSAATWWGTAFTEYVAANTPVGLYNIMVPDLVSLIQAALVKPPSPTGGSVP